MSNTHHPARIVFYEVAAFALLIAVSWSNELIGFSAKIAGGQFASNWHEAVVETIFTICVAIPTILLSYRLSRRLVHLEGFLRVCSWCRKVGHEEDWISFEEFANKKLGTQTTHGICPECSARMIRSLSNRTKA